MEVMQEGKSTQKEPTMLLHITYFSVTSKKEISAIIFKKTPPPQSVPSASHVKAVMMQKWSKFASSSEKKTPPQSVPSASHVKGVMIQNWPKIVSSSETNHHHSQYDDTTKPFDLTGLLRAVPRPYTFSRSSQTLAECERPAHESVRQILPSLTRRGDARKSPAFRSGGGPNERAPSNKSTK